MANVPDEMTRELSGHTGAGMPGIDNRYVDVVSGTDSRYSIDGRRNIEAVASHCGSSAAAATRDPHGELASPTLTPRRKMPVLAVAVPEVRHFCSIDFRMLIKLARFSVYLHTGDVFRFSVGKGSQSS